MARRALSAAEVASLGLDAAPKRRALAPDEVGALGLDAEAPSPLETYVRGAHSGALLGFRPALSGAARVVGEVLTGAPLDEVGDIYRAKRDEVIAEDRRHEEANPELYRLAKMGGTIGTSLIPGMSVGKGLSGAVATGALQGGAQALGESEADLTRGEFGEAARDVALGATLGGAAGGVGHGVAKAVGAVASKVAGRGARGVAEATAEERARQAAAQAGKEASALGKYRSAVQSASRDLEVLGREGAELPEGSVQRSAREFIEGPEGLAVREQVVGNKLTTAPERIAEMQRLRGEHEALVAGREGLIDQATADAMRDPLKRQFAPRIATLGHRFLPMGALALGSALGVPEAGALAGGAMALASGRPGIIIRNLIRSPAARAAVWQAVQRAATVSPQSLGRFGAAIGAAIRTGASPLAEALHARALENDPEYQGKVLDMLNDAGGAQ